MDQLTEHTRWMTGFAAGLATATLTLPPIAGPGTALWQPLGVTAAILLGLSAACGLTAAKLYVVVTLGPDLAQLAGVDPEHLRARAEKAVARGGVWALVQQVGFALGGVLSGLFLIMNMLG